VRSAVAGCHFLQQNSPFEVCEQVYRVQLLSVVALLCVEQSVTSMQLHRHCMQASLEAPQIHACACSRCGTARCSTCNTPCV
jgi:hypothetical protein